MKRIHVSVTLSLAICVAAVQSSAQPFVNQSETTSGSTAYARTAGLVIDAPLVIDATVRRATALKPEQSPGIRPGRIRVYLEADVGGLIRGSGGVAARVAYLADVPLDSRGRAPKIKNQRVMLFARTVAGRPGEVQLIRTDAQLTWTPALDAQVRAIAAEVVRPDAAPRITGIGSAVHVRGNLTGEGETTIFLTTPDNRPVSLIVVRRPGQQPTWSVSLSEVVTDTVGDIRRDTLLWYRLACALPPALTARSTEGLEPADAAIAGEDYQFVRTALGTCSSA